MNDFISLEHISKSYGSKQVLSDLSFQIPYGKVTAITAPSGAGKTTLLRILLGLEAADSGRITGLESLKISAVFQEDRLCENLTALANIQLVAVKEKKAALIHAMEQLQLFDCSEKPVRELSGGMKRRISILRALSATYDFLVLDEPFRGLDDATKKIVMDYTKQQCTGKTVLFVTHDRSELSAMNVLQEIHL